MLIIWVLLTTVAIALIYFGSKFIDIGYNQLGAVMMLVGVFQLIAEMVALF
jgi:hypothetical protein